MVLPGDAPSEMAAAPRSTHCRQIYLFFGKMTFTTQIAEKLKTQLVELPVAPPVRDCAESSGNM